MKRSNILFSFSCLLAYILREELFCQLAISAKLIDALPRILLRSVGIVYLETEIESYFFTVVHQLQKILVTIFLIGKIKSLSCHVNYRFVLIKMLFKHSSLFRFSQFYHPCRQLIDVDYVRKQSCRLATYVGCYRQYGHYFANLDPLAIYNTKAQQFYRPPDLNISYSQNLEAFDFSSPVIKSSKSIEELENKLRAFYLGTSGVQFQHVTSFQEKQWLYSAFQQLQSKGIDSKNKVQFAKTLIEAEALDHYLHKKFNNFKRYSGEGAQSTIVALKELFQISSQAGIEHIVLGMPHRGRFNLLVNVLDYDFRYLCRKIAGKTDTPLQLRNIIDDVTSHIAPSTSKKYGDKQLNISMVHNPSHLEAQNPVAMGKARSKQQIYGKDKVLSIQVHGDAAVCAQGIVSETLCLSKTPNFQVNGSIHIITNNQIGYTTRPIDSRPSKYPSDLFKAYDIPILHVNGENIEDVYRAVQLASSYQAKFKKDFLIDLVCYRKYGHNQVDEPEFTQPIMYNNIRKLHEPNTQKYAKQLQQQHLVDAQFYEKTREEKFKQYEAEFAQSQKITKITLQHFTNPEYKGPHAFTKQWSSLKPSQYGQQYSTGVDKGLLSEFAKASCFYPSSFAIHPRIKKYHIDKRLKSIEENKYDWATCEALAFFSLNYEGFNVRMTGQDVERGTFSQRHLNLIDQKNQSSFNSLNFFSEQSSGRGKVEILNSCLSQNAAMSYEYGYSIDHPNNLAIWQAQFGDFYNTAQVVVDVFLSNSENKWLRQSSLTLILPHGFDGAGPQHSSCRIQRFLQLANSDGSLRYLTLRKQQKQLARLNSQDEFFLQNIKDANFSMVFPSTPANLFHVLRRQMKRNFRKPLVIAGPKTLLRLPDCISKLEQLGPGTQFLPIVPYCNYENIDKIEVLFLASGKLVYDIHNQIKEKKSEKTCLLAIQELFPFPEELLEAKLKNLTKQAKVFWIQEQNFNGGAFQFIENRVNRVLKNLGSNSQIRYVGRRAVPSTAVGSSQLHKSQGSALAKWINQLII